MTDRRIVARVVLSLVLVASDAALAQEGAQGLLPVPDYGGDLWHRSHLTGDWGGKRTDLANKGAQVDVDWTQYVQGVVDGGLDRSTRYGGHVDYLINLDLMRMGLIPGGLVRFRAESRYGDSVNGISGQILPVNTTALFPLTNRLDEDVAIAITDLNYTQFLSEHLAVLVGKLDTLDADPNEFASGRGKSQFMNANFLFNSVVALRLPYSTLGAGVLWLPTKNIAVNGSIINTTDSSTDTGLTTSGTARR
jgi:porin